MAAAVIDLSAELDRQGVRRLIDDMQKSAKGGARAIAKELKFAAWGVTDACRTATQISPKTRPIKEVPQYETFHGRRRRVIGMKTFEVERLSRKGRKTFTIKARGKREAKKDKRVIIDTRGLAARAWHWAQGKLGSKRGGGRVGPKAQKLARRYSHVEMNLRVDNPMIKIKNKLEYAMSAFKTSGEQTVNDIVARAGRRLEKIAAAKLAKKLGAK